MILVVGGGIAGLSVAWELARRGEAVTVVERHRIGRGASWAAPAYHEPTVGDTPLAAAEWRAHGLWPAFVRAVETVAETDVDFRADGQLRIAYPENEAEIRDDLDRRLHAGWQGELVAAARLRSLEPGLSDAVVAAAYLPQVTWVDGRKLCAALATAIARTGGVIREGTAVRRLAVRNGAVEGVDVEDGRLQADRVVLAAGFDAGRIGGLPAGLPRCNGVRGVSLTLGPVGGGPPVRHLIKRPDGVVCPRRDGRVIVGVTREPGRDDPHIEAGTVARLLLSAIRAVPDCAALPFVEAVVGWRPYVAGHDHLVGAVAEVRGLFASLGHGAAGYLRAPLLAMQLADAVTAGSGDPV